LRHKTRIITDITRGIAKTEPSESSRDGQLSLGFFSLRREAATPVDFTRKV
jgi:hypothetical protein